MHHGIPGPPRDRLERVVKQAHKTIIIWAALILMVLAAIKLSSSLPQKREEIPFSRFLDLVAAQDENTPRLKEVEIRGEDIEGTYLTPEDQEIDFHTTGVVGEDLQKQLHERGVSFSYAKEDQGSFWQSALFVWFPMLLIFGIFFMFMRQIQGGSGRAMSFGKSKAKLLTDNQKKVTFADVAGIEEAKEELWEIVEFLKDPKKFTRLGGRIPKGVLLMGPPGTGKTLLARGVAGEAGVPFFSISGSDFVEMFVGVGASRVRDLFEQGKKHAPCIIFIDEIDAVGRHRGAGLGGGHDEREQTLNQLLVEMDGFESNEGVILVAATNRPDVLDPALLRAGRFDRRVVVPLPDIRGREGILEVHTRRTPLAPDVELDTIAKGTPGFSGADLENLVNEAALLAARRNKQVVEMADFEDAKDKVLMGTAMKSRVISEQEKKVTAYHEAGHALVSSLIPGTDPIHKVTIIPRGQALGVTQQLPSEDRHNMSRQEAQDRIAFILGGRIAEEVVFEDVTTGAGNDLKRSTDIARKMVCEWGMSEKLGPLTFGKVEEQIFLGREISRRQDYSSETAVLIDREVHRIVMEQYQRAKELVRENRDELEVMANALLEFETISGEEVRLIIGGATLDELRERRNEKARREPHALPRSFKSRLKPEEVTSPVFDLEPSTTGGEGG